MTASLRRLAEGLWVILLCRISGHRFRRHHRARARHLRMADHHTDAMAAELLHRAALCARYGGRPGPSVPRTGSGVPAMPLPSPQAAVPCDDASAVPSLGVVPACPEEGAAAASVTAEGDAHLS